MGRQTAATTLQRFPLRLVPSAIVPTFRTVAAVACYSTTLDVGH